MDILTTEQTASFAAYRQNKPENLGNELLMATTLEDFIRYLEQNERQTLQLSDANNQNSITLSAYSQAGTEMRRTVISVDDPDYAELSAHLAQYFGDEQAQ